ncbi:helix-turn-helix domain-containing protein [Spirosoma knui]
MQEIAKQIGISKMTLYKYLRAREVEIGISSLTKYINSCLLLLK